MKSRVATTVAALAALATALVGTVPADATPTSTTITKPRTRAACDRETSPFRARCFAEFVESDGQARAARAGGPAASSLTPAQVQSAYKLTGLLSGHRTVAIVDAYGYPNLEADLAIYRDQFDLPTCTTANGCLTIMNQRGGTTAPAFDLGWAQEQALDVDAVSATCPDCYILVVQADSADVRDLGTAVNTASRQPGVAAISNSYGGGNLPDSWFGAYFKHPGIAVTASTGDYGYKGASYPASSRYVTAVGGTTLRPSTNARGWTESAWRGAGSGCTKKNGRPLGQKKWFTKCSGRAVADVSAVADPATGLGVVFPTSSTQSAWGQAGGTSLSAPIIASVYALSGVTGGYANKYPYAHRKALFDVKSGRNGTCRKAPRRWCYARSSWDGPTGLGTPNGIGAF